MNLKEAILTNRPFVDKDGFKYQYLKPTLYNLLKDGSLGDEVDAEYLLGLLLGDEDFKLTAFPVESDLTLVSGLSLLNTNRVLRNSLWPPSVWVYKSTLESLRWPTKDKVCNS